MKDPRLKVHSRTAFNQRNIYQPFRNAGRPDDGRAFRSEKSSGSVSSQTTANRPAGARRCATFEPSGYGRTLTTRGEP
jgi:hypothetical protein